jgi:flagellar biosynthesis protein FliP
MMWADQILPGAGRTWLRRVLLVLAMLMMPMTGNAVHAQAAAPAPASSAPASSAPTSSGSAIPGALDRAFSQVAGGQQGKGSMSLSLQLLLLMGLLSILPSLVLMMTSFTRILIVLSLLRQALGLQQSPPNQVLIGLSLFLSLFVMGPTLDKVNAQAIQPYAAGTINAEQAFIAGGHPFHDFMVRQTRAHDLLMFADMAHAPRFANPDAVPWTILLPAFVTSELKTAFQIGFMLFLPFLVIDIVVSSVLMSLGMMMMSPTVVSLPFKLLLFVLVDGWALLMGSLASSFA